MKVQCCSGTRHSYTVLASGMSCKLCGKVFSRGFNLRRHENDYCSLKNQEREMSETESSQTMDSEDDVLTDSTRGSESPVSTDNESETEEDPWVPQVDEAMQEHKTAFEENKFDVVYTSGNKAAKNENCVGLKRLLYSIIVHYVCLVNV